VRREDFDERRVREKRRVGWSQLLFFSFLILHEDLSSFEKEGSPLPALVTVLFDSSLQKHWAGEGLTLEAIQEPWSFW